MTAKLQIQGRIDVLGRPIEQAHLVTVRLKDTNAVVAELRRQQLQPDGPFALEVNAAGLVRGERYEVTVQDRYFDVLLVEDATAF